MREREEARRRDVNFQGKMRHAQLAIVFVEFLCLFFSSSCNLQENWKRIKRRCANKGSREVTEMNSCLFLPAFGSFGACKRMSTICSRAIWCEKFEKSSFHLIPKGNCFVDCPRRSVWLECDAIPTDFWPTTNRSSNLIDRIASSLPLAELIAYIAFEFTKSKWRPTAGILRRIGKIMQVKVKNTRK